MFRKKKLIKLIIAAAIIGVILWLAGEEIYFALSQLSFSLIFLLIGLQIITLLLIDLQWWYIFLVDRDRRVSYLTIIKINLAAKFVESVTPASKLGGESAKIYMFRQITGLKTGKILAAAGMQKSTTFLGLFILILPVLSYWPFQLNLWESLFDSEIGADRNLILISALIISAVIAGLIFLYKNYSGHIYHKFISIKEDMTDSLSRLSGVKHISILTAVSFAYWLLYPVKVYILANYIFGDIGFTTAAAATFIAYFVSMIPLSPGGLGGFEATMALVLSQNGLTWQAGLSIAFLLRIFTFWLPLLISALTAMNISANILTEKGDYSS